MKLLGCCFTLFLLFSYADAKLPICQGATAIQEGGRYKLVSDGDNNNMIMMAVTKVKTTDEGEYRVVIENEHGKDEKNFMLYVSDSSGMDFRSMLKKKKYAKWGNDDEGLFLMHFQCIFNVLNCKILHNFIVCKTDQSLTPRTRLGRSEAPRQARGA